MKKLIAAISAIAAFLLSSGAFFIWTGKIRPM